MLMRAAVAGIGIAVVIVLIVLLLRVNLARAAEPAPTQPMWFNHIHHVKGYGIDCRYCHYGADRVATAVVPPTATCLPCHNDVWLKSKDFEPVLRSGDSGQPIPWRRVNDLPDFVFFNHGVHVRQGVGCETCHGRVDQMAQVQRAAPLTMGWCLECHRHPERYIRPREEVTTMGWVPPRPQQELGPELVRAYGVKPSTTCSACHR